MDISHKHKKNVVGSTDCGNVLEINSTHLAEEEFNIELTIKETDGLTAVSSGQVTLTFSNPQVTNFAVYNVGDVIKTAPPISSSANWADALASITNNPTASDGQTIVFNKWNYSTLSNTIEFNGATNSYELDVTLEFSADGICTNCPVRTKLGFLYSLISRTNLLDGGSLSRTDTGAQYDDVFLLENNSGTTAGAVLYDTSHVENTYLANAGSEVYSVVRDYSNLATFYSDINPALVSAHPPFNKNVGIEHLFQTKSKWTDGFYIGGRAYHEFMSFNEAGTDNTQIINGRFSIDNSVGLDLIKDIEVFTLNQTSTINDTFATNIEIVADFTNSDSQTPPVGSTPIVNTSNLSTNSYSFDFTPHAIVGQFFRVYMDNTCDRYNNGAINYSLKFYVDVKLIRG